MTDNLVEGEVVHPEGVRVLDDDDTYLVVAADKGTATMSDTANRVAERYGFWLGDAFASGGSNGYDHKALGITARGAWESLKRHFRELDLDPRDRRVHGRRASATCPATCSATGCCCRTASGSSPPTTTATSSSTRTPTADRGFAERKRLFELAGSSWDDYDRDAISEGGGVWPRSAKSIPLSPEIRAALGVEDEALAPTDVIRAILRAPVDVLWNGGIGTVVKASFETDADAHDRSSDAIRVDASDLRCRVVAEGGNLGLTQRARIEFAAGGGRINADFIDNSAGVDCSDHEVNLKILLNVAVDRDELDAEGRDDLLRAVTDDVAAHVLYDSFLQAQILAQEVRGSAGRMYAYEDLMAALEGEGLLDRDIEFLPSSEEMAERRRANRGLERPELAVLLAYAKRALTGALLRSDLPEEPFLGAALRGYFPPLVVDRFGHLLGEHPLRRELVATIVANHVIDSLGPTFVSRLMFELGAQPADVVRAYLAARDLVDAVGRWEAIERLDRSVDRGAQWELMEGVDRLVEATARWYLRHAEPGFDLRDGDRGRPSRVPRARGDPALARRRGVAQGARGGRVGPRRSRASRARWPATTPTAARWSTRPTSWPSHGSAGARSRRSRARSSGSARRCSSRGSSARSSGCPSARGCSAGRCRPCATTSSRRGDSWPSARCATRRTPRPTRRSTTSSRPTRTASRASPGSRGPSRARAPTSPA